MEVRTRLGVRSVKWKVEKRVLARKDRVGVIDESWCVWMVKGVGEVEEWGRRRRQKEEEDERRKIVTWNVRSLSMREHNRDRLRRILDEIGRQEWEIVLMTEIRADEKGVVWLGGDEERVAVIHSERAAIVLRGQALEEWIGEGQKKWLEERVVTVVLGGMRLVSVYQPIWGTDEGTLEGWRGGNGEAGRDGGKRKVIGGDFNASVDRNQFREGQFLLQQRVLNPRTSIGL